MPREQKKGGFKKKGVFQIPRLAGCQTSEGGRDAGPRKGFRSSENQKKHRLILGRNRSGRKREITSRFKGEGDSGDYEEKRTGGKRVAKYTPEEKPAQAGNAPRTDDPTNCLKAGGH